MIQMPYFISMTCLRSNKLNALRMWKFIRDYRSGSINIMDKGLVLSFNGRHKVYLSQLVALSLARKCKNGWFTIVGSRNSCLNLDKSRLTDFYYEMTQEELEDNSLWRTRIYAAGKEAVAFHKGKSYLPYQKIEYREQKELDLGLLPQGYQVSYSSKKNKTVKKLYSPKEVYSPKGKSHKRFVNKAMYLTERVDQCAESANKPTTCLATDCSLSFIISYTNHATKATWSRQRKKASDLGMISVTRDFKVIKTFKTKLERNNYFNKYRIILHEAGEYDLLRRTRKYNDRRVYAVVEDQSSIVWTSRFFVKKRYNRPKT